ncbi:hypothetical protein [Longimicrobium sp.]|uniref:hypothetical protein n=1 Tax=Longimicrobium sp. TaxID=2029185 RepID=UPI002D803832|nr:hypothetical protein [Longimicrobium sp.]
MTMRPRRALIAALALLAAACANPRDRAAGELRQLQGEMEQHRTRFGRYPDTLDPALPATAANLPHRARRGVTVALTKSGRDGYLAVSRHAMWSCWVAIDGGRGTRIDCNPNGGAPAGPAASPADPFEHAPAAPADSARRPG